MIRHRPHGRGHAYLPSLDQRIPAIPMTGDVVEIRAVATPDLESLMLEVEGSGKLAMSRVDHHGSADAGVGHLDAAASAGEDVGDQVAWTGQLVADDVTRYRIVAGDETTDWFEFAPARWEPGRGAIEVVGRGDRLMPDSIEWLIDGAGVRRARFGLRIDPGQSVIGFGERFNALNQRGSTIDTVVFEQYRGQGARTYLPVPFAIVVGGDGWGFWVETTRRCWFDVADTEDGVIWVTVALGDTASLKLHLWAGPPVAVLDSFLDATGRPAPVADWALRPWISGNEWNTQERVLAEVERSLAENIAVGVVVIEAWSDEATFTIFRDAEYEVHPDGSPHRYADFTFPEKGAWPDPKGMVDRLHELGIKVILWQIPLVPLGEESPQLNADREALLREGMAVREADGSPYANRGWWFPGAFLPDFTSLSAAQWWIDKRRYLVTDLGIDGFKTDGGEHAWGDELRFADGSRGDETNNRFPNLYAGAFHRLLTETKSDGLTFSRAGHTGAGRFPAHWAGDEESTWEGFRASLTAGLSAAVSGVFVWSWDLGGFSGEIPDAELYMRSAEAACFVPIMQYHSEFNHHREPSRDRTPWNIAKRHGDPEVLQVFRRYANLHDRLVPYLSGELHSGIAESRPLMRPLCFDWPDDPRVWTHPLHYMLGKDILVAPVTRSGATTWNVYLPDGDWLDAWTGGSVGPGVYVVDTPIDRIPVYVRRPAWGQLRSVFHPASQ